MATTAETQPAKTFWATFNAMERVTVLSDGPLPPIAFVTEYGEGRHPGLAKTLASALVLREACRMWDALEAWIVEDHADAQLRLYDAAIANGWDRQTPVAAVVRGYVRRALKAAGE